jgi:hypothetical protein
MVGSEKGQVYSEESAAQLIIRQNADLADSEVGSAELMASEVPLWLKWTRVSLPRLRYFLCRLSHSGYWHSVSSVVTKEQRA